MISQPKTSLEKRLAILSSEWGVLIFLGAALMIGAVVALTMMLAPNPVFALLLPLGIVGIYVIFYQIEWALVGLVFMVYTNLSDVMIEHHGAPSVAKLIVPALLAAIIGKWMIGGPTPRGWLRPLPFLAIWVSLGLAGMLYAVDPAETQKQVVILVKNMLIAITVVLLLNNGEALRKAIWALLIAGIFLGTISVIQYLRDDYSNVYWGFARAEVRQIVGETNDYRISGPIGDANSFGQIMLVIVPLGIERLLHERNVLLKLLGGWAAVVSTLTVTFTFSRGAFLGLAVMGVLLVIAYARRPSSILAVLLLVIIVFQAVPPEYTERITSLTTIIPGMSDQPISEGSIRGRSSELQSGWMMFRDHPFFGVGLGNYSEHYLEYSSRLGLDNRRINRSAHSLYMETLAEMGIFGLLALLAMIGAMLYYINQARNELSASAKYSYASMAHGLGIAVIGYLTAATFLHDAYPRFFWLLLGICFALPEVVKFESRYYE